MVHLIATVLGTHIFTIDGEFADGVDVFPITSTAVYTVHVVPEPGMALLMGLGLAGLAIAHRRGRSARLQIESAVRVDLLRA